MKAINKILTLHKTNLIELETLEIDGYINGIGGEGFNLDRYVRELVYQFYNFDEGKAEKLFKDLRILALIHDMMFWKKQGFIYSNYCLARNLFILLHFGRLFERLGLALGVFILTSLYGKKYYK